VILDSSAIVAIVREEAGWERLYEVMATAESLSMSAASYVEMGVVVDNADDPSLSRRLDHLLERAGVEIAAVDADQARLARAAHRDFGRGTGHPRPAELRRLLQLRAGDPAPRQPALRR
jgi:ribonuclease VapC